MADFMKVCKAILWCLLLFLIIGISIFAAIIWVCASPFAECCVACKCFPSFLKFLDDVMRLPRKCARAMVKNCN